MPKYKITIEKIIDPESEEKYPSKEEIYSQTVENLDITGVIYVVNKRD